MRRTILRRWSGYKWGSKKAGRRGEKSSAISIVRYPAVIFKTVQEAIGPV